MEGLGTVDLMALQKSQALLLEGFTQLRTVATFQRLPQLRDQAIGALHELREVRASLRSQAGWSRGCSAGRAVTATHFICNVLLLGVLSTPLLDSKPLV